MLKKIQKNNNKKITKKSQKNPLKNQKIRKFSKNVKISENFEKI